MTSQQPEVIHEKQRHKQELIQEIRGNNRKAPKDKQTKIKIIRNQLYIDGEKLIDPIIPQNPRISSSNPQMNKRNLMTLRSFQVHPQVQKAATFMATSQEPLASHRLNKLTHISIRQSPSHTM